METFRVITIAGAIVVLIIFTMSQNFASIKSFNATVIISQEMRNSKNNAEILVVTAFINLGTFQKGTELRGTKQYFEWATAFGKIKNHVVCFTDDDEFYGAFRKIRANLPTTILQINRSEIASFQQIDEIRRIFSLPNYPKFEPDTTNAEYIATVNAKYDFINMAMNLAPSYNNVMWLDMGLFRNYRHESCFYLTLPEGFNCSLIAYNEVGEFPANLSAKDVIYRHLVWVCGCVFVGTREKMSQFVKQYKNAINRLISLKLISTDQQTLIAMYSDRNFSDINKVGLQAFSFDHPIPLSHNIWFHLGYKMRSPVKCYDK